MRVYRFYRYRSVTGFDRQTGQFRAERPVQTAHGGLQMDGRKARVPRRHAHVLVPQQLRDGIEVRAGHHHPARGGVSQVVQLEVGNT